MAYLEHPKLIWTITIITFIISSFADRRSVMWSVVNAHKHTYRIYSWWYRWALWRWPVRITFSSKAVASANQNTPPDHRRNQILYLRSIQTIPATQLNTTQYLRKPYQNKHNLGGITITKSRPIFRIVL